MPYLSGVATRIWGASRVNTPRTPFFVLTNGNMKTFPTPSPQVSQNTHRSEMLTYIGIVTHHLTHSLLFSSLPSSSQSRHQRNPESRREAKSVQEPIPFTLFLRKLTVSPSSSSCPAPQRPACLAAPCTLYSPKPGPKNEKNEGEGGMQVVSFP